MRLNTSPLFYVFAYTFQPEYCRTNGGYGCAQMEDYWTRHFTIHGLWPQYIQGGYPTECSTEPFSFVPTDELYFYWPNIKKEPADPEYDSFWTHEWTKHGTCSTFSQPDYFQNTLALIERLGTPDLFVNAVNHTVNATELRNAFSSCALECDSGKYISGVYTCWTEDLAEQIECPAEIIKEDTCTSDMLIA